MFRLRAIAIDVVSASVVLVPIFLVLHKLYFKKLNKTALYAVFSVYLVGVFSVVGLPTITDLTIDFSINIIPFIDMVSDFKNAVLNVILFVPLGVILPFAWEKFRKFKYILLFGLGMTAAIEILQIFTFRLTDINDLMTNSAGTVIGYFISKKIIDKANKFSPINGVNDVYILCGIVFAVMFLIKPFISSALWDIVLQ